MANEMGIEKLESTPTKPQENSSYKIKSYQVQALPSEYRNLIIAPFLNSLRYGNDFFKLIDKDAYYKSYGKYVESLLERAMGFVRLAVLDDGTVAGWSLHEKKCLHYIWVKKEVWNQGIGSALMPKDIEFISHLTNKGLGIWISKYPHLRFNPFI